VGDVDDRGAARPGGLEDGADAIERGLDAGQRDLPVEVLALGVDDDDRRAVQPTRPGR
jgi:hypothetical protein